MLPFKDRFLSPLTCRFFLGSPRKDDLTTSDPPLGYCKPGPRVTSRVGFRCTLPDLHVVHVLQTLLGAHRDQDTLLTLPIPS